MICKLGFKVTFAIEIDVNNSFYGIFYKDCIVSNISLSETNFSKSKLNALSLIEEVKRLLSNKEKFTNPLFFKEMILKLNENILNL
jgi:hypothetical protein